MKKIEYYGNKNIISQRLKSARLKLGLSQTDLSAKMQLMSVNIDQQMISKIEHNTRLVTDYELVCFSLALGVDLEWLVGEGNMFK